MKKEKVNKTTLGFLGLPLTLVNMYSNKKNKVNGLGNLEVVNNLHK